MYTNLQDSLFELEEQLWKEGGDFFRKHVADAVVMVLPDPAGVLVKDEIMSTVGSTARWATVDLEEHRVMQLDDNAAVVTYKATARRAGDEGAPYVARASSAYVRDGRLWKLAFHQQTPLSGA